MIVAGIDPGKTGAMFWREPDGTSFVFDVPQMNSGPKGKLQPNFAEWAASWSSYLKAADHIFIERVGAMPGQGVTSMFSFGYSAGFMYGLVVASGKPHTFLTPQSWKKIVGLSGSDGEQSRARASQLMPGCARFWPLKKHDGRAEAALIAWAGKLVIEGKSSGKQETIAGRSNEDGQGV